MDGLFVRLKPNRQIQEEAAEWLIELNAGTTDEYASARLDEWLRASPEHIRAYIELLPLWHDSASLGEVNNLTREQLIELATRPDASVIALPATERAAAEATAKSTAPSASHKGGSGIPARRWPLAFAAMLLLALAAVILIYSLSGRRSYKTEVAEVRSVTLEDGTKLSIGARSAVAVRYTKTTRTFRLEGGDIYVDVAKDVDRPFIVEVRDNIIRALGTQFEVRADEEAMRIAVIEGAVSVSQEPSVRRESGKKVVLLSAGQQLTARRNEAFQAPQPIRGKEFAAWRTGRLVFDDADLGDVIREFNRYNVKQLRFADPALERIPVAAAFSSADPRSLIRFLQDQPGIAVTEGADEILIEPKQ